MKKLALILSILLLCASLFAAQTLSDLFPDFSEEKIGKLRNGETFEAYTCYGNKIADIAPAGSLGRAKAIIGDRLYKGFSVAALSFIPYPENFRTMSDSLVIISLPVCATCT